MSTKSQFSLVFLAVIDFVSDRIKVHSSGKTQRNIIIYIKIKNCTNVS